LKLLATPLLGQELTPYEGEAMLNQMKGYQCRVGSVMYLASIMCPDVAFLVSRLAEFLQNPSLAHLAEINRLLTYFYDMRFFALEFFMVILYEINQVLKAASDASFANDALTCWSSQGFLISLFNGPIAWQVIRQKVVIKFTMEAELLALLHVSGEVEYIVRIFKAIRFNPEQDIIINCNN